LRAQLERLLSCSSDYGRLSNTVLDRHLLSSLPA
jgi:hypothetical protein